VHAIRAGDFTRAHAHLLQADQISAEIGEQSPGVPVNLGWVLRHEGDLQAARAKFVSVLQMSRRIGDKAGLAYASLGVACIASDLGDWRRAGELHGAAQAFIDRIEGPWQEPEDSYRRQSIMVVRQNLGVAQFDQAYARGRTLTFDNAMDLVLGRVGQHAVA
jgi:hypothetical protein